jgi:hypothetical protein
VGIVSFGYGGCAANKFQDVYVNVATYAGWIDSMVQGENCQHAGGTDPTDTGTGPTNAPDTSGSGGGGTDVEPGGSGTNLEDWLECLSNLFEFAQSIISIYGNNNVVGGGGGGQIAGKGTKSREGGILNFFGQR